MSEIQPTHVYISPDLSVESTIPRETDRIPVAPISAWAWGAIGTCLVFPSELDVERLKGALARLGVVWPTLTGRFEKHPSESVEGGWDFSINLTSSPIPFSTQTLHPPPPQSSAFPTLDVIQPSLSPYVPALGDNFTLPNSSAHLFAVRLTTLLPSKSCVLGINISHVLGDGYACMKMIRVLEALYLGQEYEPPTFLGHVDLPEWEEAWQLPSTTLVGHGRAEWIGAYTKAAEDSEPVLVTLRKEEAEKLKAKYSYASATATATATEAGERAARAGERREDGGTTSSLSLSVQDVITAWWISILQRLGEDVRTLIYVINYRTFLRGHPAFPPTLPSLAANAAQMRFIDLPLPTTSPRPAPSAQSVGLVSTPAPAPVCGDAISEIASTVRRELNLLRSDASVTLPWLSNAAHHIYQAAVEEKGQILVPEEGHACVNANIRMNWHATFGFPPDRTSYHTTFSMRRFLRVFQGNPRKGEQEGDRLELVFNVPKGRGWEERVAEIVEENKKGW